MAISPRDIKLLWGRAASRCSICRCELTQDKQFASSSFPLGEQAHIVAEEVKGPRGNSMLPVEERNSYYNLILLCPTHHTIIDKNVEDYPVERLYIIKSRHELWVQQTLSNTQSHTDIEMRPISHLLEAIDELKPILFWLYKTVPAAKAEDFFRTLQEFWSYHGLAIEDIDSSLTSGMEILLRPLASGHFYNEDDHGYTKNKISFAYQVFASYFGDRGLEWQDHMTNFEVSTILSMLGDGLMSVYKEKHLLDDRETNFVRFALFVTKYFLGAKHKKRFLDIPEGLVREFSSLVEPFFTKLGFQYPDSIESLQIERLREACDSNYSSLHDS